MSINASNINTFDALPTSILETVESCARGCYQRSLLRGEARWSGSDLKGEAKRWSGHYNRSRRGLLGRINKALGGGWSAHAGHEHINSRLRTVLVVTSPEGERFVLLSD